MSDPLDDVYANSTGAVAPQSEWLEGFDIVTLVNAKWMAVRSIPEYLFTRLAKKNRVLVVEPFNSLPTLMREAKLQQRPRDTHYGLRQKGENFWIYTPPPLGVPLHTRFSWVTKCNNAIWAKLIQKQLNQVGLVNPLLWSFRYNSAGVMKRIKWRAVIYDSPDNDMAMCRSEAHRRLVWGHESETLRAADLTFTCAEALSTDRRPLTRELHEVFCATDPELFRPALDPNLTRPADLADVKGPVIGYVGGVDTIKLDIELIKAIAKSHPEWTIALVGFVWFGFDRNAFAECPNIRLLGPKKSDELPAYMRFMDVCTAPFALNDTTLFGDSLKVYEYLSAGRPVVSTPIPSALRVGSPVRIARTAEEFIAQIEAALLEGDAEVPNRLRAVATCTWDHRVAEKSRAVRAMLQKKGADK